MCYSEHDANPDNVRSVVDGRTDGRTDGRITEPMTMIVWKIINKLLTRTRISRCATGEWATGAGEKKNQK